MRLCDDIERFACLWTLEGDRSARIIVMASLEVYVSCPCSLIITNHSQHSPSDRHSSRAVCGSPRTHLRLGRTTLGESCSCLFLTAIIISSLAWVFLISHFVACVTCRHNSSLINRPFPHSPPLAFSCLINTLIRLMSANNTLHILAFGPAVLTNFVFEWDRFHLAFCSFDQWCLLVMAVSLFLNCNHNRATLPKLP